MASGSASDKKVRWGILSTASIARKNWQAIKLSDNAIISNVASRSVEKAQKFIDECQAAVPFDIAPTALGSYDELLASEEVDAVYIPLPTGMRKEWVIRAAAAGKHVLCEKPCACNHADLSEMVDACRKNNVQFMDGVMYMHANRFEKIREVLDRDDSIGKLKRIATQFSFCGDDEFAAGNIRTNSDLEPLGCLGDLGWYTIRFALWVMNYEMPTHVTGRMLTEFKREDSAEAVPMEIEGHLQFSDGISSSFYNSFITGHQQWGHISGLNGHIHLTDFVLPYKGTETKFRLAKPNFETNDCDFEMKENPQDFVVKESANSATDSEETNLFRNFSSLVLAGKLDDHWPTIALQTQKIMDAVFESAKDNGRVIEIE
ncbi:MAG: Gfo/Idh/MocA family protein [Mariniblastus sp.]